MRSRAASGECMRPMRRFHWSFTCTSRDASAALGSDTRPLMMGFVREHNMNHSGTCAPSRPACTLRAAIRFALIAGAGGTLLVPVARADQGNDVTSLEEVVVTATRREQTILDVPYSISFITGATPTENHIQSLSDLSHMV